MNLPTDTKLTNFTDEVKSWLQETSGYVITAVREVYEVFSKVIVADSSGKILLEIKLIALQKWQESILAKVELSEYWNAQKALRAKGIHSIVLWEDIWIRRKAIVKSRLLSLLGFSGKIPGRLTVARRITKAEASDFLERNHMQGATSSNYQFGLFLPERYFRVLPVDFKENITTEKELLTAVATFSHPRIFQHQNGPHRSYELIRFTSLLSLTVVGGFGKLISAFIADVQPDDIMTYADLEWSGGENYGKMGFQFISDKDPMKIKLDLSTLRRIGAKGNEETGQELIWIMNAGSRKFVRTVN